MNLPNIAIKNAQFVLIMALIAIVVGVQSLERMPRSEDPQVNFPFYRITVIYPGTSPEDMENLIADPLEEALEEIEDIQEINTIIEEGKVGIGIDAEFSVDPDEKYDEIVREINSVRNDLPEGIVFFDIIQPKPSATVVIHQYALQSESVGYKSLVNVAEAFEDQLNNIDYLLGVDIEAYPEEEIRISLDFQRMANQNISLPQVVGILQQNNANIPGGSVKSANRSFSLKTTGGYKDLADIRRTVISAANGNIVYLKDIATVEMGYEDPRWIGRYNGKNAIFISLRLKEGKNILQAAEAIQKVEQAFMANVPANMELLTVFEQAPAVAGRIDDFFVNLLQGVALVGFIILLFLGWRSALIIMLIIPLCILISLAILNGVGFGLQQISIAALVLALGLLVDNGIVVVENITNFVKQGFSRKEAA
ncbi:MAG: efflux RND transporter permease subunit, partial [Bacteroidota bacterium]